MGPLKIAIAGCGPAGLSAALLLHRDGHHVTLFERFEAPRPIGSGLMLQPTGLAVLQELGLTAKILDTSARIHRLFGLSVPDNRLVLDVHYRALSQHSFGIGIHRAALFDALFDAILETGIQIETGRSISGSKFLGKGRSLCFANGADAGPFDLVVDALGSRSALAPPSGHALPYGALWVTLRAVDGAGFDPHALEQRYRAAHTMAGVLPLGQVSAERGRKVAFFWSLRADRLAAWQDAGLAQWKSAVENLWPATRPLLDQITEPEQLTFARYAHRTLPRPMQPGLIHIGDAWHSASPQLGQGANMALLDAYALVLGLRTDGTLDALLKHAIGSRRNHVTLYQMMSAMFTPAYQSDSNVLPAIRDRIVGPLSRIWPGNWIQAAMVSGLIGNPLKPLGLKAPQ